MQRQSALTNAWNEYQYQVREIRAEAGQQHSLIDQFRENVISGHRDAIINYYALVLRASMYPADFPSQINLAYVAESKQIIIERDLPTFAVIPEVASYKYIKVRDEVTSTTRPLTQRKALYNAVVAQMALRTLYETFQSDQWNHVDTIVFNGYVEAIDKATGHLSRACLVSVRVTKDVFSRLDLGNVDPTICLQALSATVLKSPAR